ncbi:hypothetical protein B0J13DRAFT_500596 [Dactylonectria estremocensis]|uniref:Uncharacterized protein n=1 Tax=Dactylonectria estremocensis TaxID=1079267 RepID=A0A9P9J2R9_9HYPO|nr:hypothetical protein B0J13DRAFT_500596 [Dactylonectria estremocensis]
MKAAFFSVLALAISALAAPVADANNAVRHVNNVENTFARSNEAEVAKRAITSSQNLISTLQGAVSSVKTQGGSLNGILSKVQSGDISKDQGADQALPKLNSLLVTLTNLVTELTGSAGLDITDLDVKTINTLVIALVSEVTTIVKGLLTILGVRPQLDSVLHSVFQILAKVLILVIGLVGAIVPGLVVALSPLLVGIGNGLLAPLLTLIAGLLAGLAA